MLKLIRIRKWHIPNALAVAAAFLLLASSLARLETPVQPLATEASLAVTQPASAGQPEAAPQPLMQAPVKKARKFRVSLFLFRH
jgi:hypothetical protein